MHQWIELVGYEFVRDQEQASEDIRFQWQRLCLLCGRGEGFPFA
jgi:hypothetical protein